MQRLPGLRISPLIINLAATFEPDTVSVDNNYFWQSPQYPGIRDSRSVTLTYYIFLLDS